MAIEERYYVTLKGGKRHPTYPGVLLEATRLGLKSLTTDLIQIPGEENGHMAIVKARAEFGDGRVFEDYGDCSPRNSVPMIAAAAIRMASTRGKGRVLRDGIGLGETMAEEIGHAEPDEGDRDEEERVPPPTPRAVNNGHPDAAPGACVECGLVLTPGQRTMSVRRFGQPLCPAHQAGKAVTTTTG